MKGPLFVCLLGAWSVAGCAHVPPQNLVRDRFDYTQAVAESWKRQMLANIVRLRYADAPVFMDVNTIINTYSMSGNLSASPKVTSAGSGDFPFGASTTFSNTPTVTYQPLTGERFMKSLLRPIPPASVFQMLEAGWTPQILLRLALRSMNGLENQLRGTAPDPRFLDLLTALGTLQRAGGLNIRVEERKEGEVIILVMSSREPTAAILAASDEVRNLLGLDGSAKEFTLRFGLMPSSPTEIAVLTRSMMEIMLEYSFGVDVPAADQQRSLSVVQDAAAAEPLVKILTSTTPPAEFYASVPYRNRWYWIEDTDLQSKARFTFLMILSSLAETGTVPLAPLITVGR